jgi:hypothetical protein
VQRPSIALPLSVILVLAGCSAPAPVAYQGLASAGQLQPAKDAELPFQYLSPTAELARYPKLLIDPVTVYAGGDGQFGTIAAEDRRAMAGYMQQKFAEALGGRYQLVTTPEPGALRLHLTLTGLETSTPVISTVTHLAPMGLALNTGLEADGDNGTFFGSVTYAAELSDATSGALLYAYVTRQTPDALDVSASFGSLAAAREGVRIGADHLAKRLAAAGPAPAPSVARQ